MTCQHDETEAVETGLPGDVRLVARLCTACLARVPLNWGCEDCEWEDLMELGSAAPIGRVCSGYCEAHQRSAT